MIIAGYALLFLSAVGSLCLLVAAWQARRLQAAPVAVRHEAVSILKPLHGAEPALLANLATFLDQDHDSAIQVLCGVRDAADPAIPAVEALRTRFPDADIVLVVDPAAHGSNAKISNLLNMMAQVRHPILILSDSDMAVPRDYLARVLGALDQPGVGAVTCFYRGRGDAGGWSRLAAMGISQHFLPSVLLGTALGLATPCMGSTIAMRRETLDAIGGLAAFADLLADDYAIGAAVRAQGQIVALPAILLEHGCAETGFAALVRQELRWNRTIALLDRAGFAGSVVLHPLPLALLGGALGGFGLPWLFATAVAFFARGVIARRLDPGTPVLWIPTRDLLSFILFLWTFAARSVDWRGAPFNIKTDGRLSAQQDQRP